LLLVDIHAKFLWPDALPVATSKNR